MPNRFFITGTDTGVGKTVVSALLCAALDACYWKPIQTGTREGSDRTTLRKLAQLPPDRILPESYRFAPPVSPHLAAQRAGVRISLRKITVPRIPASAGLVAEGAGGVLVPLNETQFMTDLMRHLRMPVVLVCRTALGTINHTLLSLAALRKARLDVAGLPAVAGVVMVGQPNRENRRAIERYGNISVVGYVPKLASLNRRALLAVFERHFDHRVFRP